MREKFMISFSKVVSRQGVEVFSSAQSRKDALKQLAPLLEEQLLEHEMSRQELYDMAIEREHVGSTSVGHGIAFAHCNSDNFKKLYAVIGIFPDGILSWSTPDDEPVYILFLIASPGKEACRYFAFISHISRMLRAEELVSALKQSRDPDYIYDFFAGWEKKYSKQLNSCGR